ncbi:hypothetical protein ACHHYP_15379 [Achlya hypogyna]|uniref:Uncharacterized protein n=1 Tax=Achlya hypogyna TaxID=1202772 RepID=A0A1V9YAZ2_ACHHY|nr:hypothetical protein ACHHYP_15379 [Achlya hypogyna]
MAKYRLTELEVDWFTFITNMDVDAHSYQLQLVHCAPGYYAMYPFTVSIPRYSQQPVIGTPAFELGYTNTTLAMSSQTTHSTWFGTMGLPLHDVFFGVVLILITAASTWRVFHGRRRLAAHTVEEPTPVHPMPLNPEDKRLVKIVPLTDTTVLKAQQGAVHDCDNDQLLVPVFSDQDEAAWREFFDLHIYRTEVPSVDEAATSVLHEIKERLQRTRSGDLSDGAKGDRKRLAGPLDAAPTAEATEKAQLAQECVDMLVAHGYPRASVAEIPIYERVVGGLVFCLQSEELTSVDCDILFRPVASVKERVRVAEAICHSFNTALHSYTQLTNAKSTLNLSVHELQGANYSKLRQVVAWLVQHTQIKLNTRVLGAIEAQWATIDTPEAPTSRISGLNRSVTRRSKFHVPRSTITEQERIQRCLLEYGEKTTRVVTTPAPRPTVDASEPSNSFLHDIAKQAAASQLRRSLTTSTAPLTDFERQYQTAESEALAAEERALQEDKLRETELLQHATTVHEHSWRQADVANLQSVEAALAAYDAASEDIRSRSRPEEAAALGAMAEKRRLEREAQRWADMLQAQQATLAQLEASRYRLTEEKTALETAQRAEHERHSELKAREAAVAAAEAASNQTSSDLAQLRELIAQHTSSKLQEVQFKASCKEKLVALEAQATAATPEQDDRLTRLEASLHVVSAKRMELKKEVAREARGVAAALRLLDDIPCKAELLQYEKRFLELYEEVALTLEETRKYFAVYNTLEATHEYLEKEVALVDSINANVEIALGSKAAADAFFAQMTAVIANVQANVAKQQAMCESRQLTVDTLDSKYQLLLEKQQAYVAAIRDFQRECERNEKLQSHLEPGN